MVAEDATVTRDGKRMVIDATDVVYGDLVELGAGKQVPADIRIIRIQSETQVCFPNGTT
jgi:magnesium-transporting ATPase (P-type)